MYHCQGLNVVRPVRNNANIQNRFEQYIHGQNGFTRVKIHMNEQKARRRDVQMLHEQQQQNKSTWHTMLKIEFR